MNANWKTWSHPEDLPIDLRRTINQAAFVPLLDPEEAKELKRTIMESFSEVLDFYLDDHELRWRISHVKRACPELCQEAVFAAVAAELGVSVARLRTVWFSSRRKAQVRDLVHRKLKETI